MSTLKEQINQMNENELKDLLELITKRQDDITSNNYKQNLIPNLFKSYVTSVEFCTNYVDDGLGFECYDHIYCNDRIHFNKKFTLLTGYAIYKKRDWNSSVVSISLMTNKYDIKIKYHYNHNYNWSNENGKKFRMTELELNESALKILDLIGLDKNTFNKKMLGIMINNIIMQTMLTCDDARDYDEEIIVDNNNYDGYDDDDDDDYNDEGICVNDNDKDYLIYSNNYYFKAIYKIIK